MAKTKTDETTTSTGTLDTEQKGLAKVMPITTPALPPANTTGYVAFAPPAMTEERRQFLKRQFCPKGCTDLDFEFFVAYCERTGLDPVLKQAYLVERWQKVKERNPDGRGYTETWVRKFDPLTAEAGMAAKADGLPDYRGIRDGVVFEGDEFSVDYAEGVVVHKSNPLKRGKLIGAWAHVRRDGRDVPITWLRVEERMQTRKNDDGTEGVGNHFWSRMAPTMILKCARAEQWRQAYPNVFGGQYVPEEMRDERDDMEVDPPTAEQVEHANRDTTDKLVDQARASKAADASREKPTSVAPASQSTVDVVAERPKTEKPKTGVQLVEERREAVLADILGEDPARDPSPVTDHKMAGGKIDAKDAKPIEPLPHEVADAKKAEAAAQGPLMIFGTHKGKPIASLGGPELHEQIIFGESKIGSLSPDKAAKVRACIDQIKAEMARRDAALLGDAPEPGSDG